MVGPVVEREKVEGLTSTKNNKKKYNLDITLISKDPFKLFMLKHRFEDWTNLVLDLPELPDLLYLPDLPDFLTYLTYLTYLTFLSYLTYLIYLIYLA